MFRVSKLHCIT